MVKIYFTEAMLNAITQELLSVEKGYYHGGLTPWLREYWGAFISHLDGKPYIWFKSDKRAVEFVLKYA